MSNPLGTMPTDIAVSTYCDEPDEKPRPISLDDVIAYLIRDDDPLEVRDVIVRGASPEQVGRAIDESRAICPDIICSPVTGYGDEWAASVLITLPRSTWLELDAKRAKGGAT